MQVETTQQTMTPQGSDSGIPNMSQTPISDGGVSADVLKKANSRKKSNANLKKGTSPGRKLTKLKEYPRGRDHHNYGKAIKNNTHGGRKKGSRNLTVEEKTLNLSLANSIVNNSLKRIAKKDKPSMEDMRTVVMPIVLKGMAEKQEISGGVKVIAMSAQIADKYKIQREEQETIEGELAEETQEMASST